VSSGAGTKSAVVFAELGNVLTKVRTLPLEALETDGLTTAPEQHVTPTSLYLPQGDAAKGAAAVLAAAGLGDQGSDESHRVALIHLHGLPRAAVIGLAGLATTELTIQAALRRAGSSVVQVKSTDPASLEAQLIEVRAVPLDLLLFTGPARQTAERLMAGGGPRARTGGGLLAMYNGPQGEHDSVEAALDGRIPLEVLPPMRPNTQSIEPGPTEEALSAFASRILDADPLASAWRGHGFVVDTFARAFTAAGELTAAWWRGCRQQGNGDLSAPAGMAAFDLGGRYCEMAVVGAAAATRAVTDLDSLELVTGAAAGAAGRWRGAGPKGEAGGDDAEAMSNRAPLSIAGVGRWLPYDYTPTGLGDTLANYLRRPFVIPANWQQLLLLMALGRERLIMTRTSFRASPGDSSLGGDWRRGIGMYLVSGGYFGSLPGPAMALSMAIDGLEPVGVSEIWCDRWGLAPHIAASPALDQEAQTYLTRLATVVAPQQLRLDWRRPHDDDILALVTVEREGVPTMSFRIVPGSLARFPLRQGERARLTVHPLREHDFGAGPGKPWRGVVVGGRLGLVFDSRGRPVALPPDGQIRQAKLREWLNTLGAGQSWEGAL